MKRLLLLWVIVLISPCIDDGPELESRDVLNATCGQRSGLEVYRTVLYCTIVEIDILRPLDFTLLTSPSLRIIDRSFPLIVGLFSAIELLLQGELPHPAKEIYQPKVD
jgi:hypothetical protein